jgi:cell division transport system ATP-binding protein
MGSTVILATHDKEVVNSLGERVITLENGKVVKDEVHGRFII